MNNIEGQEVGGEQGCARVHEHQEYVEDEVQNKATVIIVIFTVISPLKVMVKRKTCVFQIIQAEKELSEGECQPDCQCCYGAIVQRGPAPPLPISP